jgi:hypothetical protein
VEDSVLELLEEHFPKSDIKQRRGKGGMLSYLETYTVVKRLNKAFNGDWSFQVISHEIIWEAKQVIVQGRLTAQGISKDAFGSSDITYDKETKSSIVDIGSDIKAANSDCVKKCATYFGVGAHLYLKDEDQLPGESVEPTAVKPPADIKTKSNGKATGKQVGYIMGLTEKLHPGTRVEMVDWLKTLNIDVNNITFEDASKVISTFEEKLGIVKKPKK